MSLLAVCQWIQGTDFFTALRGSWYVYPAILTLHLSGIALFGGMILTTDLRLLGWVMRKRPVSDVVDQLRGLKRIGFVIVITCGLLMAGTKAEEYYYNTFFWIKMSLLGLAGVHALVFRRGVYNNLAELDRASKMPGRAKLAASLSLLIWAGIACSGRGIGYVEPQLDRIHASVFAAPSATR